MKRFLVVFAVTLALILGTFAGYRALADEEQPHMHAALHHLEEAQKELQMAAHDKGGHREKAMELTRNAIEEVKAGVQFADKK